MMSKGQNVLAVLCLGAGLTLGAGATPAFAQQSIDEPELSPMLFGPTKKEREERAREEREKEEEAKRISYEQQQDSQDLDEPRLRPLAFGPAVDGEEAYDRVGTRITSGEEGDDQGFFGAFNFLIPDATNLSIGVGPVYEPDYFGSDDYEWNVDPQVYVRFRNFLFLDDDGVDIALFGFSGFKFGPTMKLKKARKEEDNPALLGLGDVGTTFEFGGFAATTFLDRFAFKAKVRHGLKTGHRGTVVEGSVTALIFRSDALSLSTAATASWVGNRYADAYFSVTPEQSIASMGALAVHEADAGFRDIGASATAYINIFDRWSLNPYVTYSYIYDNQFANSPIVADYGARDQFRFGFHLMREFTFGDN